MATWQSTQAHNIRPGNVISDPFGGHITNVRTVIVKDNTVTIGHDHGDFQVNATVQVEVYR